MNSIYIQCFLVVICLASYQHALDGNFVFDDTVAIVKNKGVTTLPTNYTAILQNDFWGNSLLSNDSHKSYRPLTTFMFHIEVARLQLSPKHMKLINLLLHCLNTILLYRLIRQIYFMDLSSEQIAAVTAAFFAVHPVHTEAVCGIVGRADLMFCLIYLMALLVTIVGRRLHMILELMLVSMLTTIGIFYKETAITIPLACVFVDYMQSGSIFKSAHAQIRHLLQLRNILYAVCTLALLWLRLWLQNFSSPAFKAVDNPIAFNTDKLTSILSQNYLYAVNLWILICPQWLSFDWALGCIELVKNIADLRLQAVLCFYSIVIVMLINYSNNFGPLLSLGLMVIPFLPASGIIKVGFVIAERVLYVPSIGYCLLVAYAIVYFHTTKQNKYFTIALRCCTAMVLLCFLLRTRQRASDWRTEEALFSSALKVCPNNAKVHYNIARIATDQHNKTKAFHHYHKAIELYPAYESALMNLGNLYREQGDLILAERYIKAAIAAMQDFPTAWMNLGIVQAASKRYAEALSSYQQALKYRKNYANCYYNMGNLFLDQQRYAEAMQHWQQALHLNEQQPKAWANVLTMLDNRGLHEDGVRMSERALSVLPNDVNIMFIRANLLGKLKHYVEAEQLYLKVISLEHNNSVYYTNLGVLYHRWGKLTDAVEAYKKAVQLNPNTSTAKDNLKKLLERMENTKRA